MFVVEMSIKFKWITDHKRPAIEGSQDDPLQPT